MQFGTTRRDIVYAPLLAVLFVFVMPVFILANNSADLQHIDAGWTLGVLGLLATTAALVMLGLGVLLRLAGLGWLLLPCRFLFFFFLITGLVLPLTASGGQVEAWLLPPNDANLVIALALSSLLFVLSFTGLHAALLLGAGVMLLFTTASLAFSSYAAIYSRDAEALRVASATRNIFVVSFDGLPRDVGIELLRSDATLRDGFRDFTIFEQAASNAPATFASIMAELSGLPDLKQRFGTEEATLAALDASPALLTNLLAESGYSVSTYGHYGSGLADQSRKFARGSLAEISDARSKLLAIGELFAFGLARLASPRLVPDGGFAAWIPEGVEGYLEGPEGELVRRVENHAGSMWDTPLLLEVLDFENYVSNLRVDTTEPVAHFLHFTHTHFPVDFDRACEYRSDDPEWYQAHQNPAGLKQQTECALSQFLLFAEQLRALGIYDNSLIIFKSDHGEPISYQRPDELVSFSVRGHAYWGMGRYTPFLAVKGENAARASPLFDPRPVALVDLASSICQAARLNTDDCSTFGGYELFQSQSEIPEDARYGLELVRDETSSYLMDDHDLVWVPRSGGVLRALNDFLTSELLLERPDCGNGIEMSTGRQFNNGLTDDRSWVTWREGSTAFVKTRAPACAVSELRISMDSVDPVNEVWVNGMVTPFAPISNSDTELRVDLTPQPAGSHIVVAIEANGLRASPIRLRYLERSKLP